ncbi:TRAP transporter small permease [Microvirga thermotolerans]|uniref:TRAP transporter small permease protein n=1 Tax=Microvirga thermotolerans TaxID=2651334 RepID=A0A5P9JVH2_9HYPH|nr:TRAP transporter small permease [Microvirga thermotolerans]QFU16101.1 TRAP transporter small permease subunit [Microvirga thermotolerans]
MKNLAHILRGLIAACAVAGVLAYAAAALVTVADIVGRQIGTPILGVVDLVQLFVVAGAWLVIPYAFLTGAHVGVDLLVESFPKAAERLLRAVASVTAAGLLALMLVYCYDAFQQQLTFGDRSQQLGIPIMWYWVPLLVGTALSIVAAVLTIVTPQRAQAAS